MVPVAAARAQVESAVSAERPQLHTPVIRAVVPMPAVMLQTVPALQRQHLDATLALLATKQIWC